MPDQPASVGAESIVPLDQSFEPGGQFANDAPTGRVELSGPDNPFVEPKAPEPAPAPVAQAPAPAPEPIPAPTSAAPNWNDPSNPYLQRSSQLEAQQFQAEVQQADYYLSQQYPQMAPEQRKLILNGAIAQYQAAREQIQIESMLKPVYVQNLVNEYKTKGVDLDPADLSGFSTPTDMQTYARSIERRHRSQTFDARAKTGADRVDSVPAGVGQTSSGGDDLAAALAEADRRRGR